MKTTDFTKTITGSKLSENLEKQFGVRVNLEKYNREQLEDFRNKLRTRIFQQEGSAQFNDLLTNETYQKDKAMLELLNTRIKEMLGEQMQKLRDKLDSLNEGKKVSAVGEGFEDKLAAAKEKAAAKGKPVKDTETKTKSAVRKVAGKAYGGSKQKDDSDDDKDLDEGFEDKLAAAKEKAAAKGKPVKDTETKTKSAVRKVAGKAYGGSNQKQDADDSDLDEGKHPADCDCDACNECSRVAECGQMEGKPSAGLSKEKKSATVKKAKAGGDIGKKGKGFKDVAAKAAKEYGSKEKGEKVAAAAMWKNIKRESVETFKKNVRIVNEGVMRLLNEDEEGKAKTITAASDMVNDFTSWMQRVGQYQTKAMIELADQIRADFSQAEAEAFKQAIAPALSATLDTLTQQRETISNAVAVLAGEDQPVEPMGMEPAVGPESPDMEPAGPDALNPELGGEVGGDEFGASDAAAGGDVTAGRDLRESREIRRARKLAESHRLIATLAK